MPWRRGVSRIVLSYHWDIHSYNALIDVLALKRSDIISVCNVSNISNTSNTYSISINNMSHSVTLLSSALLYSALLCSPALTLSFSLTVCWCLYLSAAVNASHPISVRLLVSPKRWDRCCDASARELCNNCRSVLVLSFDLLFAPFVNNIATDIVLHLKTMRTLTAGEE